MAQRRYGFTLVELMVVIVIIGILAALIIPRLTGAASKARLSEFKPILKNIYVLQQSHFHETGSYSADSSVIGFASPSGKVTFHYDLSASGGFLGSATMVPGAKIRLSDAVTVLTTTDGAIAKIDDEGLVRGKTVLIAQDAGLFGIDGTTALVFP